MKESRQIDKKDTFQVRIDRGWQSMLLKLRATSGKPIRKLVEDALSNTYGVSESGDLYVHENNDC